ncbi:MAG: hypothetical protein HQK86_06475 [Nitrospinae bacterium]|nr:hypothetical protein [Nitrospinota bacterium]MBF0635058.1 hypothetical protein [Nitrospinota bacterium]
MKHNTQNDGGDYKTCPKCALPHKLSDTVCSYCGEKLPAGVTVSERVRRVVGQARWRYKMGRSKKRNEKPVAKALPGIAGLVVCAILIAVGSWFLYTAVQGGGFSDFLIAVTLILYGVGAGYNILRNRG